MNKIKQIGGRIIIYSFCLFSILYTIGCSRRLAPTSTVTTKDSIVYRDTTVFVNIPIKVTGDSVTIHDTIIGIPKTLKAQNTVTKGKNTASYKIDNGTITVDCNTAAYEDTIKDLRVKLQTSQSFHSKDEVISVPVEVIKYKTPNWIKWLLGIEVLVVGVWAYTAGYLGGIFTFLSKLFKK